MAQLQNCEQGALDIDTFFDVCAMKINSFILSNHKRKKCCNVPEFKYLKKENSMCDEALILTYDDDQWNKII